MGQIKFTLTEAIINDAPEFTEHGYAAGDELTVTVVSQTSANRDVPDTETGPHPKDRTRP